MNDTKRTPKFDLYMLAALMLALFSFAMAAILSRTVFERLPHLEDEVAYLFQAQIFVRGDLVVESPQPATPFWKPFVVDAKETGTRFSKYTPGWSALLAIGVALGQTWWVNAVCGMLTVLLTYRLGREVFSAPVGIIAAALVAFSPMALLLNASLMGHTSALMFTMVFMFAYARLMRPNSRFALRWGLVAGIALGLLVINRPLTGVAIALPFVLWSLIRLVRALVTEREHPTLVRTLKPLVALGGFTLLIALAIPLYNAAATGNPTENLYTRVWAYDKVGFGEGFGRSTHTIQKGVQFARYDLSLMAADLFGWQIGTMDTNVQKFLAGEKVDGWPNDAFYPYPGLSWLLLLPGLVIGFRGKVWVWLWALVSVAWLIWLPSALASQQHILWLANGLFWCLAPLMFIITKSAKSDDQQAQWTWLLLSVSMTLVAVHLAYWIGSQRYSTRYYFEILPALAILSAIPVAWVIQRVQSWITARFKLKKPFLPDDGNDFVVRAHTPFTLVAYAGLAVVCVWSLFAYSLPRIDALRGFNRISPTLIEEVNARRITDKPVLVLVNFNEAPSWRSYGALMIATNPYLDSDIVAAWDNGSAGLREQLLAMFPDREIIEMGATNRAGGDHAWFIADCGADGCPVANPPRAW